MYQNKDVQDACNSFFKKYYTGNHKRHIILGINPGRFGGGITGIPFTDPIRLEKNCGIQHSFQKKPELSSVFIYDMIEAFGGAEKFYNQFYISAISPLGFVKHGKNMNYYDDANLLKKVEPFAINCMLQQMAMGIHSDVCFCIGEDKNHSFLQRLNEKHKWFASIVPLPHPRFVMQYRLKKKQEYIERYIEAFREVVNNKHD